MAGAARQKIDRQTLQMFDPEVVKPEHDQIMTTLFNDTASLEAMLRQMHRLGPLKPFAADSQFYVRGTHAYDRTAKVDMAKAVELTGKKPTWKSDSPIRLVAKQMEVLLDDYSNSGRSHRLMGFIDIGVAYDVVGMPSIERDSNNVHKWVIDNERKALVIEVKSSWPTVGNLMRQLNLYRACIPRGFGDHPKYLLVGPDDSMNEVAQQHGYRLATFDASGKVFTLAPERPSARGAKSEDAAF